MNEKGSTSRHFHFSMLLAILAISFIVGVIYTKYPDINFINLFVVIIMTSSFVLNLWQIGMYIKLENSNKILQKIIKATYE